MFRELADGIEDLKLDGDGDTYHLIHGREHTLDFRLHWVAAHGYFRAYVRAATGEESNAIASLYTLLDASRFCGAVESLIAVRAGRHVE